MNAIKAILFALIFLLLTGKSSLAVDPSILWGTWETKGGDIRITIRIMDNKNAILKIRDKVINNAKYSYCYGEPSIYPFLSLFGEAGGTEHYLYGVIGGKGKHGLEFRFIRGFYEVSKVDKKREAIGDVISYPLELIRVLEKPRAK
jgi:hypothetical protein